MTARPSGPRRLLQPVWNGVQRVAPGLAARIRRARAARGGGAAAIDDRRVERLERDLALMADQLAALTARLDAEARGHGADPDAAAEVEARLAAARLGAVAFYEERISRIEDRLGVVPPSEPEAR